MTKQVKLDDRTVTVAKLPIGKYAQLLKAFKKLPKQLKDWDTITNEQLFERLPLLIAEALPDVIDIVEIATPLKKEEIEKLGLDEMVRLIVAIFEVNNYREVFDNIKKVIAQPKAKQS